MFINPFLRDPLPSTFCDEDESGQDESESQIDDYPPEWIWTDLWEDSNSTSCSDSYLQTVSLLQQGLSLVIYYYSVERTNHRTDISISWNDIGVSGHRVLKRQLQLWTAETNKTLQSLHSWPPTIRTFGSTEFTTPAKMVRYIMDWHLWDSTIWLSKALSLHVLICD